VFGLHGSRREARFPGSMSGAIERQAGDDDPLLSTFKPAGRPWRRGDYRTG
jgi:hypothetical protein